MAATLLSNGGSLGKPKKQYQILGDYQEFESQLQAALPPPKIPDPDTVENVDYREFPPEVWFAATISPDKGAAIIKSFREVYKARCARVWNRRL